MTIKGTKVTSGQLHQLLEALKAEDGEPGPDHLGRERFVEYALKRLNPDQVATADAHLASCPDCRRRMDHLLAVSQAWDGENGERRLSDLSARILTALGAGRAVRPEGREVGAASGRRALVDRLRSSFDAVRLGMGLATDYAGTPREATWPESGLSWRFTQNANGDLIFSVSSFRVEELEGVRIQVSYGGHREVLTLTRHVPGQVDAELVIPRAHRQAVSDNEAVRLGILDEDA